VVKDEQLEWLSLLALISYGTLFVWLLLFYILKELELSPTKTNFWLDGLNLTVEVSYPMIHIVSFITHSLLYILPDRILQSQGLESAVFVLLVVGSAYDGFFFVLQMTNIGMRYQDETLKDM